MQTIRGNPDKFDCELAGRIIRVHLTQRLEYLNLGPIHAFILFRKRNIFFNVVNFHGYVTSKKGNRSKIELLEKLKGPKALSKRRKNILGGNFNFVEHDRDRKSGGAEELRKEKPIKDTFLSYSGEYNLYVRINGQMKFTRALLMFRRHMLRKTWRSMKTLRS